MTDPHVNRYNLPIGDRPRPRAASIDVRDQDPPHTPPEPLRPPKGAPNVVLVLLDDMGFGAPSTFGGPCRMPAADRLAAGGLRYTRFHVAALCSPTRQSLLTGRNHHSVGMGVTTEMASAAPGYDGIRPRSAAPLAQVLRANGYSTAAFGKWHQTPAREVSPVGPFDRWPTGEGFEKFYGFLCAEMNHWHPVLFDGTTPVEPDRRPEDGYHLSEDLVDQAIEWMNTQRSLRPDTPFFLYLPFGATHAPYHVPREYRDRYRGRFDHGWDRQREITLRRQKELGVVPQDAELAPWADGVPHWDELSDAERRAAASLMELYAGFAEHTDDQVGRLVDALDDAGALDDTLFIYVLGDNGASAEGGLGGTLNEHRFASGIPDTAEYINANADALGDATTHAHYPVGWALAMNTPYPWTKQVASHFGGTRDGMVVHWPNGIEERGGIRHQFHHVIDVMPTVLEAAGIPAPATVDGVAQQAVEGTSMLYSFNDVGAPDRRRLQYFEMVGNRGIYHDGWMAVTRHGTPWEMVQTGRRYFDDDVWELYDTNADWSQARDISAEHPGRLRQLQQLFLVEAGRHNVFPLDDRMTERENPREAGRLDLLGDRRTVTFHGPGLRLTEETAPNVKNRSHTITARVDVPAGGAEGVIAAQGGRFGGWSLYVHEGRPAYAYNYFGLRVHKVAGGGVLPPGAHEIRLEFGYDGGGVGRGATVTLHVDGAEVAAGRVDATIPYYFAFDETFDIGVDRASPVTDDYPTADNAFTGRLRQVRLDLSDDLYSDVQSENERQLFRAAHD
ncbi:arylsulfatase [Marinitenerispora sediminis]|uniref:Arylsulfatase n=1 Tax=Marinitenerispora sediminis TaxID=1931232 RepID=A0A368T804_9ACTN|nr:arylsulfatase [Marinitenerispora sediminis]RCV57583.1 arylsulfatase [Marinitenerispora sediminis]RCV58298.1 arylsulfatase [Marinitenerispora sediminis]RCV59670.1 arylsulfatase [Marinitenerispora sediminis]